MKIFYSLLVLVILVVPQGLLTAQDSVRTWTGVVDNNFENTQNWIPNGPPENTHVIIPVASLHPVLSTVPFASVRSVNILSGGQLDIALTGQLSTSDSIRIDSSGTLLVTSTHSNPVNVGSNSIIGGTFDISQTVGGTMNFNGKLVVLSTGTFHIRGTIQIPNIRDDVILNGLMTIDSTVVARVWCGGNWVRGAGSSFNAGSSIFYFTNPLRQVNVDRGTFHSLILGPSHGLVRIVGNVAINTSLLLRDTVAVAPGDTLTINNTATTAIRDTLAGRLTRGTVRRILDTTATATRIRFHDNNIAVQFDTLGIPRAIIMTAYPDTVFGPSPANYYVKRFYAIDREGGGNFRAHVYLRYDPSEVHPGVPEDSLRLWRTTNNGQTWIFVGGSVDLVNHLITADSVREFSKWAFGTPSSPTMSVREYGSTVPTKFSLSQNYPNPFNPNTKIQVDIPNQSFATLKVYNILGQEIATLLHGEMQAGTYEVEWKPDGLPSGVYLYRLQVYSRSNGKEGSYFQTRKMVLLR